MPLLFLLSLLLSTTCVCDYLYPRSVRSVDTEPLIHSLQPVKDGIAQIRTISFEFNWREPYRQPEQKEWQGSAFFVKNGMPGDGYLLTNYHVAEGGRFIQAIFPQAGMEWFDLEVVGVYPALDCALLRLKAGERDRAKNFLGGTFNSLPLGDSDNLSRLDASYAVGYPLGQLHWKITKGIICGIERPSYNGKLFIQIDAPINPGNSGGPVLNSFYEVIGMATAGVMFAQNVGYVIPINDIKFSLGDLVNGKNKVLHDLYCGIEIAPSTDASDDFWKNPHNGGALILRVHKGSLAEKCGIKINDKLCSVKAGLETYILDRFGEITVPWCHDRISLNDLINRLRFQHKNITLTVYRSGIKHDIVVSLQKQDPQPIRHICPEYEKDRIDYEALFGMVVMQLAANHLEIFHDLPWLERYTYRKNSYKERLILTHVVGGSQADRCLQLSPGALIRKVNDCEVSTLKEFRSAVLKSKESGFLKIQTENGNCVIIRLLEALGEEEYTAYCAGYPLSSLCEKLKP